MLCIEICVGSSCHLKGSERIVEMIQEKINQNHLSDEVVLTGAFCTGQCNRLGVTLIVGRDTYTGITPEGFGEFWDKTIIPAIEKAKGDWVCRNA